jgi:dienelactone hydrolase
MRTFETLLALACAGILVWMANHPLDDRVSGGFAAVALLALVALGVRVAGRVARPYRRLARVTGPYSIGAMTLSLPKSGDTPITRDAAPRPEPSVRLWYPTTEQGGSGNLVERFPVLLYFPGWPGTGFQNLTLVRELVSQGYTVAAVRYAEPTPGLLNRPMQDYSSDCAFQRSVEANNQRLRRNVEDAGRILDQLALDAEDPSHRLTGRLDVQRIGIVGYSFGGAVAAEVRRLDPRVKAAVNIDGRHWGTALQHGTPPPYLFIGEELLFPTTAALSSRVPATRYEALLDQIDYTNLAKHLREHGGIQVTIAGTTHSNFTDDSLRSPLLRLLRGGGSIDPSRALALLNEYVLAFFDQSLRGRASNLLAPAPSYTEVHVDVYRTPKRMAN